MNKNVAIPALTDPNSINHYAKGWNKFLLCFATDKKKKKKKRNNAK